VSRPEKRWGIEPYAEQVGPVRTSPGGWGAEDSEPDPDRTLRQQSFLSQANPAGTRPN